jgi:DNA-binding LacI/PurR family transcriptional regulator
MGIGQLIDLEERPTAIVCFNDMMAMGVIRALHVAGLRVPDDCSVTGFDDIEIASYMMPPLTTFHQPKYELGKQAAEMMLSLLTHVDDTPVRTVKLLGTLVQRESVAPPPDLL